MDIEQLYLQSVQSFGHTNSNSDAGSNSNTDPYADGHSNTNSDSHRNTNSERDNHPPAYPYTKV